MFAKFNLKLNKDELMNYKQFQIYGLEQYKQHNKLVHVELDKYLSEDGFLNASDIEDDWFPEVDANVFLSHSHQDENAVIQIAGFLYKEYGITCFIDSTVWGYANDLLKKIDDKYCVQLKGNNGSKTYSYDKRNQSTAHVHMILQGALAKMINRCEALFFINTPRSLITSNLCDKNTTASPWIYSELLMANTFPAREPSYYGILKSKRSNNVFGHSDFNMKYEVGLSEFVNIDLSDIQQSASKVMNKSPRFILDQLYLDKGL